VFARDWHEALRTLDTSEVDLIMPDWPMHGLDLLRVYSLSPPGRLARRV
jgi:hypothetical protein